MMSLDVTKRSGHTADCPRFETHFPWNCDCRKGTPIPPPTKVDDSNIEAAARHVFDGDAQARFNGPDGVAYLLHLKPNLFAGDPTTIGGATYTRRTFITRRVDGEAMDGTWGTKVQTREREVYSAAQMAGEMAGTLKLHADSNIEIVPFHGPHLPTTSDKLDAWDRFTDAFRAAYRPAWERRDWVAVRDACATFRATFPRWAITGADADAALHGSARVIARNMRGEAHPPRFHMASRYLHRMRARGFAAHAQIERGTLEALARLQNLPGFDADDARAVIPVVLRWTGQVRHVRRAELYAPRGRFLHPVKPDGSPMPRARRLDRETVESIKQPRARRSAAA